MVKAVAAFTAAVLAAAWGCMGYKGWTWIPIGKPAGKGQIKVACVGDSITYGAMIPNWYRYNYPHLLQKKLGNKYCVHNYGMSDRTGMETGNHPYIKELRYSRSLRFHPDIVFLMFGTNDSKPLNWRGKAEFKRQYGEMVKSYVNLPGQPKVVVMQPPAPHHMDGTEGDLYRFDIQLSRLHEVREAVRELAQELNLDTLDLFPMTEHHPEWYVGDGIHPNAIGAEKLADLLYVYLEGKNG